jgi:GTP-binding protein
MPLPLVAIVGAPNVGKSTLFNRLVRERRALVAPEPGVTRDRLYGEVRDAPVPFRLVDTGGIVPRGDLPLAREVERQAAFALDEAVVLLFVVDSRAGATSVEHDLATMLRRRGQPVLLVANKVDVPAQEAGAAALGELGMGEPIAVSAEHGLGIDELLDAIAERIAASGAGGTAEDEDEDDAIDVAIVGRPNVGKSSLVNRLVGEERMVVSEIPGTTRDSVDTLLERDGRRYRLIDTAGLRRSGRVERGVESLSVGRTRRNVEACDVAILMLDATEELAAQDTHVAGLVRDAYKPMVVAVNKWDLVPERERAAKDWEDRIRTRLRFAKEVPMVLVSAATGQRLTRLLDLVDEVHRAAGIQVPTSELNRWLGDQELARPEGAPRSALRLYYATQTGTHPPRFVLFCNDPRKAHFSARRQIENALRQRFGFGPAPIRLHWRARREARER